MLVRVGDLPCRPLDAATRFYESTVPRVRIEAARSGGHVTLVFAPADHSHRAWRLAAVQELARENVPVRINALESDDEQAIAAAADYLSGAGGLTGQLLPLDGNGAGPIPCNG